MSFAFSALAQAILKVGALLLVMNEVRGLVLAAPVFLAMYNAGGTWMALWLGASTLGGIAVSVIVPAIAYRKLALARA